MNSVCVANSLGRNYHKRLDYYLRNLVRNFSRILLSSVTRAQSNAFALTQAISLEVVCSRSHSSISEAIHRCLQKGDSTQKTIITKVMNSPMNSLHINMKEFFLVWITLHTCFWKKLTSNRLQSIFHWRGSATMGGFDRIGSFSIRDSVNYSIIKFLSLDPFGSSH